MASLLYGGGLRLLECVELRVKDLNFDRGELVVGRQGSRDDDAGGTAEDAGRASGARQAQHDAELVAGRGRVALPGALRLKYPNAAREGHGNGSFRPLASTSTRRRENGADIICTSRCCSGP